MITADFFQSSAFNKQRRFVESLTKQSEIVLRLNGKIEPAACRGGGYPLCCYNLHYFKHKRAMQFFSLAWLICFILSLIFEYDKNIFYTKHILVRTENTD